MGLFLVGCEPGEPYAPARQPAKESTVEKKDSGVKIDVDVPGKKGDVDVEVRTPPEKPDQ
jgi:hypothetical protein